MLPWNKLKQDSKRNWKSISKKIRQSQPIKLHNILEKLHQRIFMFLQTLQAKCYAKLKLLNLKARLKHGKQNQNSNCNHNNTIKFTFINNTYLIKCINCGETIQEGIELTGIRIPLKWRK